MPIIKSAIKKLKQDKVRKASNKKIEATYLCYQRLRKVH
jgi:hypothetical protein